MSDDLRAAWQRATSIGDELMRPTPDPDVVETALDASLARLSDSIDTMLVDFAALRRQQQRIAAVLATFYRAPVSLSSLQPVLELAVELNPGIDLVKP